MTGGRWSRGLARTGGYSQEVYEFSYGAISSSSMIYFWANISPKEKRDYKDSAAAYLGYTDTELNAYIKAGRIEEIEQ